MEHNSNKTQPKIFQFPLSERTNCNYGAFKIISHAEILSVSSIGTNELQQTNIVAKGRYRPSFSFLYRNERTATFVHFERDCRARKLSVSSIGTNELQHCSFFSPLNLFSNLSVSSIGTNELQQSQTRPILWQLRSFQFPLSERTNCNKELLCDSASDAWLSVSSIGTNELQPMQVTVPGSIAYHFQFPLSERTNCNLPRRWCTRAWCRPFSFLYRNERTATKRMKRWLGNASCLSVSSIGTNELQQIWAMAHTVLFQHFQFPLSERTNCNIATSGS